VSYRIAVCIKQVPDTENLTAEVMKEDGTVNRAALPAIVNPEDLNALEMALRVKEEHGGHITVITMGPPSAAEALRETLYSGADRVILLTDRRFAASDTLATSYALSQAIRRLPAPDLVFCGRQAIDGDTAQIGPQLAQKLGLPQFTYVEAIVELKDGRIGVKRSLEGGYEILRGPLPALLTVVSTANNPRPPAARRLLKYKKARAACELAQQDAPELASYAQRGLLIEQWNLEEAGCDPERCGGNGSPTKVKKIESIKLVSEGRVSVEPTKEGLARLVRGLIAEHILE
jgi:electron transfer flavoprotein beta subunit